jgi:trk system potassium uptake protein TrkA
MYVVIAGKGKLGAGLARVLSERGYDVVVIDDGCGSGKLGAAFDGIVVSGDPADDDTLRSAGLDKADAFVAVTADDNKNIMSIQAAKISFGVRFVLARISDPSRESFYRSLDLDTVCPTLTGINQILAALLGDSFSSLRANIDPTIAVVLPLPAWIGKRIDEIGELAGRAIAGIVRKDSVEKPLRSARVREGDSLILRKEST